MSTTYRAVQGDTFERVARKVYGTENEASRIQKANPGVTDPIQAGVVLRVPDSPLGPFDRRTQLPASTSREVAVRIDGERFRFWESVRITRSIDSFDTVELTAPFTASLPGFRRVFRPFSFKEIDVTLGGALLFTGTLVSIRSSVMPDKVVAVASGYSLPGVLNDCTPPASAFPLEFKDQNLREIAGTLAGLFGLSVEFDENPGAVFDEPVAIAPGKKVLSFLAGLAKQRNMVIGNTEAGALRFRRLTEAGVPVANLRQGSAPLSVVTPRFAEQEYYSDITGIEPVFYGLGGSQYTVRNPRLPGVLRPHTFNIGDTKSASVADVVNAKMGRMFANAAGYSVGVATLEDPAGNVWVPGSTVTLEAPGAMVYNPYDFTIRTVDLTMTKEKGEAVLGLIMPGSFGGQIPETLPWDD